MLILSRKIGEQIVVGKNILIKVLDIRAGRVRMGIQCPADVKILRRELTPFPSDYRPSERRELAGVV